MSTCHGLMCWMCDLRGSSCSRCVRGVRARSCSRCGVSRLYWGCVVFGVFGVCCVRGVSCSLQNMCLARFRRCVVLASGGVSCSLSGGVSMPWTPRGCVRGVPAIKSRAKRAQHMQRPSPMRSELNTRSRPERSELGTRSELNTCSEQAQSAASSTCAATKSRAQRAQHVKRPSPERSELNTFSDQVQSAASSTWAATKSRAQRAQRV